jgi:two-component system, OmpR family, response regulator
MHERPHILIVDDDREIRSLLSDYLEKNGFRASAAADGKAMQRLLSHSLVDLIVLDVMLPGDDGLKLCRDLRTSSQVPIIMLTARGEDVDRIVGFELGADDYLPKPFNPRELLSRIKAVLRRAAHAPRDPSPAQVRAYRFAQWRLDTTTRTLNHVDGASVALSGAEYRLLTILLAHATRVLSRTRLMELMRGREHDPLDRSVDVRISRLRQILGDDARAPTIIKTVYGEGYVIGVPVSSE